jgi:hypothetical protein
MKFEPTEFTERDSRNPKKITPSLPSPLEGEGVGGGDLLRTKNESHRDRRERRERIQKFI